MKPKDNNILEAETAMAVVETASNTETIHENLYFDSLEFCQDCNRLFVDAIEKVAIAPNFLPPKLSNPKLIYLAVPYSHPDPKVKESRFLEINKVAAKFMASGQCVFSPISHTHPIAMAGELPTGWEFWRKYDEVMLQHCDMLVVVTLDGWKESHGVTGEIELANEMGIPIRYLDVKN